MRESIDKTIRKTIREQAPPLPESYEKKLHETLRGLPKEKGAGWRHSQVAAVIVMCVLVSAATTAAAVRTYRQRLAGMSLGRIESINSRVQKSRKDADHFSREISAGEKIRFEMLRKQYEKEGVMPQEELRQADLMSDVPQSELCYCYENSTFYLPAEELTDEQILRIIDFYYIRDYSVRESQKDEKDTSEPKGDVTEQQAIQIAIDYLKRLYGMGFEPSEAEVRLECGNYSILFDKKRYGSAIEACVDSVSGALYFLMLGEMAQPMKERPFGEVSIEAHNDRVREFSRKLFPGIGLKTLKVGYYVREKDNMMLGGIRYYAVDKNGDGFMLFQTPGEELPHELLRFTEYEEIIKKDEKDFKIIEKEYGVVHKTATVKINPKREKGKMSE